MRLHVLVEGPAEVAFLNGFVTRLLPAHHVKIHPHRGRGKLSAHPENRPDPRREGLLDQLPAKLRAFGKALNPATERVLVLLDLDQAECRDLKRRLVALLGLCQPQPVVLFRFAIEELEAFYLGDEAAIRKAFPKAKLSRKKGYEQDSISGSWELFQRVIGAGHEDKVAWAERMGRQLGISPRENQSPSFRHFCLALLSLSGEPLSA